MTEVRSFSDLDLDFTKHPVTKDVARKTKENAIIASVRNLLQTNFFERPFNPTIGSNITAMLFEPVDSVSASIVEKEISNMIKNYEPRVRLDGLVVQADSDNHRYSVSIRFYMNNSTKPLTVSLFLNRLR